MVKLSLSVGEWGTESAFQSCYSVHRFRKQPTHGEPVAGRLTARPRAVDALVRPATMCTLPCAYPTSSQAQFSFPSPPPQAATELSAPPLLPSELRRRRARAPPQKRELRLHHSSAVSSSTFSTSQLRRSCFGKVAVTISAVTAMSASSPELRPQWPG